MSAGGTNVGGMARFTEGRVVERCVHCDFTVSAPLEEARQAFAEHECDRPRPPTAVRRRREFPREGG
jgi:hypothetical protein